jgi:steroid delta-isomerase-like uncharacterized protein
MTPQELHALVEAYMRAWNERQPEAVARFHSSNGVAESPMYSTMRGRQAIEEAARAFFTSFPDMVQTVEATIAEPPNAAVFGRVNATHVNEFFGLAGTGRHVEFRVSWLIRVDDSGLIEHVRRIYDFTGVLVQIGVLRAKPARPAKP